MISHPFMSLTQPGDPPRHPPMVHDETFIEPNLPQQSIAAAAMAKPPADAPIDVEQPRHVLV